MPPKKSGNRPIVAKPKKNVPKRIAAKGFRLPDPISPGEILRDVTKKHWRLGKSVGQGGFGEIYLASDNVDKLVGDTAAYVVKIEPHSNGPLFTEMHCYKRIAKPENIEMWKKDKKLKRLGMPKFLGSGSHEYKGQKYRFIVMERFGSDLQKIIEKHDKKLSYKTVFQVIIQVLDVLEYIHSNQYIHADVKASNLLVGYQPGTENQVFLVDFGLSCRYSIDGKHKEYKFDQRRAHDGTIEFTSRDAHIGAHSRRGDLEILGYNLVQWLCGKLPWEDKLSDCDYVASQKRSYMDDVSKFMKTCFPDGTPPGVKEFVEYVASLTFDEKPNYEKCRSILKGGLKKRGYKEDGKLVFLSSTPKASKSPVSKVANRKKALKRRSDEENIGVSSPTKHPRISGRSPCKPRNVISRVHTRHTPKDVDVLSVKSIEPDLDDETFFVEKENKKMLERKQTERPKRFLLKKDNSLANPTPQMMEIMAKIREKSISPPICTKKHKHSSNCHQSSRVSPISDDPPTELTPEMESVIRKHGSRRESIDSDSWSESMSPDLFDSEEEEQPSTVNNATMYFSPCGGISPGGGECHEHSHHNGGASSRVSSRRSSLSRSGSKLGSGKRMTRSRPFRISGARTKISTIEKRILTRSKTKNTSPEVA